MAKKRAKKRDARAELLFCGYKPIAFFQFPLPSPASLLKLSIIVIQKFCYHGNVTSHFSFLFNPLNNTDTPSMGTLSMAPSALKRFDLTDYVRVSRAYCSTAVLPPADIVGKLWGLLCKWSMSMATKIILMILRFQELMHCVNWPVVQLSAFDSCH